MIRSSPHMRAQHVTPQRRAMNGALLFFAALVAYWPAVHGLWRIWSELGATQQYYPVLHSAFWFEHYLWGDALAGYHFANITLHATAAFLLFLILRRIAVPGALLAGAIFALHPVNVESVAWISEQKNTLSAVFYLAAMLVYLEFDESRKRS